MQRGLISAWISTAQLQKKNIYINFYNVAILKGEFSLGGKGKGSQLFWKKYIYKVGSKKFTIWCITACILSLY